MGSRGAMACVVLVVLIESVVVAWLARGHAGGDRVAAGWLERVFLVQHAGVHALLAWAFATTLRPGREPLIGRVAARIHRLSPAVRDYTRRLTAAWVVYFVAVAAGSCALYACLDFAQWAWCAEVGTPLLLVAVFVGEHRVRYWLHPEFERVGLVASMRAYRQSGAHAAAAAGRQA